jgi:hypothetical protein
MNRNEDNFEKLNDIIEKLIGRGRISDRSQAPIYLFLTNRFYVEHDQIFETITDGGNDLVD